MSWTRKTIRSENYTPLLVLFGYWNERRFRCMCRENGETRNAYRVGEGNTVESGHLKYRGRDRCTIFKYVNLLKPDSRPFPFFPCSSFAWLSNAIPNCRPPSHPPYIDNLYFWCDNHVTNFVSPRSFTLAVRGHRRSCDCNRNKRVGSAIGTIWGFFAWLRYS
jgi:hypothetical protein